jgi:hypothetical protein
VANCGSFPFDGMFALVEESACFWEGFPLCCLDFSATFTSSGSFESPGRGAATIHCITIHSALGVAIGIKQGKSDLTNIR